MSVEVVLASEENLLHITLIFEFIVINSMFVKTL